MNVQNPFHLVQSTACSGLELVANINMAHHAKGQKRTERAAQLWSASRLHCRPACPAICPCRRWLCSGSAAVRCSAVGMSSIPIPRPSVATAETDPLTSRGQAPPTTSPSQNTVPTTVCRLSATEVTGFCPGLYVQPHPQLTVP